MAAEYGDREMILANFQVSALPGKDLYFCSSTYLLTFL